MSHVITDYMARGLDAAKPGAPNISAGETGLYWATDTLKLYGWTGAAWVQVNTGVGGTAIVQVKSAAVASVATGVTLGAAPTNGNFLVAFIADQAAFPTVNAAGGWISLGTSAAAANDDGAVFIKLAGAGESATQTPSTSAHQGVITIFELSNAAGGYLTTAVDQTGTAIAKTATSTKSTGGGGLIIGVFVNRSTTGPTSLTGTGVTADAAGNITGVGRAAAPFHVTGPTSGLNTITANYATSQGAIFMAVSIG